MSIYSSLTFCIILDSWIITSLTIHESVKSPHKNENLQVENPLVIVMLNTDKYNRICITFQLILIHKGLLASPVSVSHVKCMTVTDLLIPRRLSAHLLLYFNISETEAQFLQGWQSACWFVFETKSVLPRLGVLGSNILPHPPKELRLHVCEPLCPAWGFLHCSWWGADFSYLEAAVVHLLILSWGCASLVFSKLSLTTVWNTKGNAALYIQTGNNTEQWICRWINEANHYLQRNVNVFP